MSSKKDFGLPDIFVVIFFLSTAAIGIYMFWLDLMRTIEAREEEPAGIIVISNNVVQRRYADRVIWERLFVDSPVYSGDLIRAADLSDAIIRVEKNRISINENTLIRMQRSPVYSGPLEVDLKEGNLSIATDAEGTGVMLNLMGRQVQIESGTSLNAELGEEGIVIMVSKGTATFIEEGKTRELTKGMMIAQDRSGMERIMPAVVVTSFGPNAHYLKSEPTPLPVDFKWNKINIEEGETVRLEIAGDRNFTRDFRAIEGLDNHTKACFEAGLWYWRLCFGDTVLSTGQITVVDASGPELLSPVMNTVFRYYTIYDDLAAYSSVSSFRIEECGDLQAPEIELPPSKGLTYTVRPGDTISEIAREVYGDASMWRRIAEANNIQNANLIFPNQVFFVP